MYVDFIPEFHTSITFHITKKNCTTTINFVLICLELVSILKQFMGNYRRQTNILFKKKNSFIIVECNIGIKLICLLQKNYYKIDF